MTERDHMEDVGVDGRIILKCKFKKWIEAMDWNDLAQDRIRWQVPVNEVINLRVPKNARDFLTKKKKKPAPRSWLVGWLIG
jgi:hypothetical protein